MELKRISNFPFQEQGGLLIVPYGIETRVLRPVTFDAYLLIVPYGIET